MAARIARFGAFEFDPDSGELRKSGIRVALPDQPSQILQVLVTRAGEVVSREELRQLLWPDGTFVDFDHSLNSAVNKLRSVLMDVSSAPRFIETVPRRGYRFVAPVEWSGSAATPVVAPGSEAPSADRRVKRWRVRWWMTAATAALTAALAAAWHLSRTRESGDAPVPLTVYEGRETYPSLSPDGTRVAFAWSKDGGQNFDIYVKTIGAEEPLQLTAHPAMETNPVWSQDGTQITFLRTLDETTLGIFSVPPTGGTAVQIAAFRYVRANNIFKPRLLAWSPDGQNLIVSGSPSEVVLPAPLYTISLKDGTSRQLSFPPSSSGGDFSPAVSAGGELAFERRGGQIDSTLYVMAITSDGRAASEPKAVTSEARVVGDPVWTADGRELVFSMGPNHRRALWRLAPGTGGKPRVIPFAAPTAIFPSVARNLLAYVQVVSDLNIWTAPVSVGGPSKPTALISGTSLDHLPEYSPDGTRVSFVSNRSGDQELWVANADGSNPRQLTDFRREIANAGQWSPDSRDLVFNINDDTGVAIYTVYAEGGRPRQRFPAKAGFWASGWSRDGRWLYLTSLATGERQVWKAPLRADRSVGQPVRVIPGEAMNGTESPDGRFLYFVRTAHPYSLWRAAADGTHEQLIADSLVNELAFAVARAGVCIGVASAEKDQADIVFLPSGGGPKRRLLSVPRGRLAWGISMRPDGSAVAYSHYDVSGSDLMLIRNFR